MWITPEALMQCGNDIRLPAATQPNSVWSYDFGPDQLVDGRALKMLCVIDECIRECLAIEVGASLRSQDVILTPSRLMRLYGKPASRRSHNALAFRVIHGENDFSTRYDAGAQITVERGCCRWAMRRRRQST
nr:hypothetical protein [Burkholderia diffusa]